MDTQNLAAFCAVAECGSFSLAAATLHLTQPAISKRVANLEQQLNCRLFDRIGRSVELTAEGQLLLGQARHILQTLETTRQALADLRGGVSGKLRLASSHHIGLHRLPPLLRAFRRQYPEVDIHISLLDSEAAYQEIRQGQHDLALVTLAPTPAQELEATIWWQDRLHFTCANDHPLARTPQPDLAQLAQSPALLPDTDSHTSALILALFGQAGLAPMVAHTTKSLDALRMLAWSGLGWAVLPTALITDGLTTLVPRDVPNTLTRQLGCVRHRGRTLSRAAAAFLAMAPTASQMPVKVM